MINSERQVPAPSAAAWLVMLSDPQAPRFVVLRGGDADAIEALRRFLLDIGTIATDQEAHELLAGAALEHVGVVW